MSSLDELFSNYEISEARYKRRVEDLKTMKCLVLTKMGDSYAPDSIIFNIRGSRYFLIVTKLFWPSGIGDYISTKLSWRLKKKNKREFQRVTLEDILDSKLISNSAKEEILFNLPVFLAAS